MLVQSYKDLDVWQRSMDMVASVYALTKLFPKEEQYTLTSQIRRAAISVPSNIAEGRVKTEKLKSLFNDIGNIGRMLNGLLSSLERKLPQKDSLNAES